MTYIICSPLKHHGFKLGSRISLAAVHFADLQTAEFSLPCTVQVSALAVFAGSFHFTLLLLCSVLFVQIVHFCFCKYACMHILCVCTHVCMYVFKSRSCIWKKMWHLPPPISCHTYYWPSLTPIRSFSFWLWTPRKQILCTAAGTQLLQPLSNRRVSYSFKYCIIFQYREQYSVLTQVRLQFDLITWSFRPLLGGWNCSLDCWFEEHIMHK